MKKYNLLINNSFNKIGYSDKIDDSIYAMCENNLYQYSVVITLEGKPLDNTSYITKNIGDSFTCYIFPLSNATSNFSIGDILYTHKNNIIFIIENHIADNKFVLRLISLKIGVSCDIYNTTLAIVYNKAYESFMFNNNELIQLLQNQKTDYTKQLVDNNNFIKFIFSKISITENDSTVNTVFNFNDIASGDMIYANIINKFYVNMQLFSYNDFKYIYSQDIKENEHIKNDAVVFNDRITGVLKALQIKILPNFSQKVLKNNVYTFNTSIINKYTKFAKEYNNEKTILLLQFTLSDKSVIYDQTNNIESDYLYLIN